MNPNITASNTNAPAHTNDRRQRGCGERDDQQNDFTRIKHGRFPVSASGGRLVIDNVDQQAGHDALILLSPYRCKDRIAE